MSPILKQAIFMGAGTLNTGWLKKHSPIDILAPYQHLVSDTPVPWITPLYAFKNTRQFEADLDYLLRHFRPLSLQDAIDYARQQARYHASPRRATRSNLPWPKGFLLCFDDGLRQVYETVAPILLRKGIPAAVFVNPDFVDNRAVFYNLQKAWIIYQLENDHRLLNTPDQSLLQEAGRLFGYPIPSRTRFLAAIRSIRYGNRHLLSPLSTLLQIDLEAFRTEQQPYMSQGQLQALSAQGFAIGAHSMDHPLYSGISREEQLDQTTRSLDWVQHTLDQPNRVFAFPHTDTGVGKSFFETLLDSTAPGPDLILGNQTGMLEWHSLVLHRFIGENPAIPMERMVKAVMAYGICRKLIGRQYVNRN